MDCQTFEALIIDLVREEALDKATCDEALAHAATCSGCAARRAEENSLSRAFRLASSEMRKAQADAEIRLLLAYREHMASAAGARASAPAGVRAGRRRTYLAIAASIFLAAAIFGSYSWFPGRNETGGPVPIDGQGRQNKPDPRQQLNQSRAEIATDFIPLTYGSELSILESGQLVRVRLPRSAMAACGLPVNQELADTPVTAQVLIGQDGVARAIRFVSESQTDFVPARMVTK